MLDLEEIMDTTLDNSDNSADIETSEQVDSASPMDGVTEMDGGTGDHCETTELNTRHYKHVHLTVL